ncbi:hypothetical protein HYS54_02215 [Candidatus Micrarchaeota archaeon]|nr:hypothetical protein [Candidatus Micrarchaeota archaeon]
MKNLHKLDDVKRNCAQACASLRAEKEAKKAATQKDETIEKPWLKKHPDPYFGGGFYPFPSKVSTFGEYIDRIYKKYAAIYGALAVFIISSALMGVATIILTGMATILVLALALTAGYHWWTYLDEHTALNNIERNFGVVRSITVLK